MELFAEFQVEEMGMLFATTLANTAKRWPRSVLQARVSRLFSTFTTNTFYLPISKPLFWSHSTQINNSIVLAHRASLETLRSGLLSAAISKSQMLRKKGLLYSQGQTSCSCTGALQRYYMIVC